MVKSNETNTQFYEKLAKEITESIMTDDFSLWKKGYRLYNIYHNGDKRAKDLIDTLFVHLCGYSLKTLIENTFAETKKLNENHETT